MVLGNKAYSSLKYLILTTKKCVPCQKSPNVWTDMENVKVLAIQDCVKQSELNEMSDEQYSDQNYHVMSRQRGRPMA